jgi:hypothetical protein
VAANEKVEAEKILQIKRAGGEAESKYISGFFSRFNPLMVQHSIFQTLLENMRCWLGLEKRQRIA